jgi:PAS domain S-box-containing protein
MMRERFSPLRVAALYAIFGAAWILLSDTALHALVQDAELESRLQTVKGWSFIIVTGGLVYWLTSQMAKDLKQKIVESERVEGAFLESEKRQRDILNNTSSVIYMKDLDGRYLFINRMYEKLFHISHQEVIGKTDHDIFPRIIADAFCANDLKVIEAGTILEFEEIAPQEDGEHTYISVKFPISGVSGEIYAVCGISTDITERKRAENALRESEERFRTVFDSVPSPIFLKDTGGRYLFANKAFEQRLGRNFGDMAGKTYQDLRFSKEAVARAHLAVEREVLETRKAIERELPIRRADGTIGTGLVIRFPVFGVAGDLKAVGCAINTDITERKRTEAALRESEARLLKAAELAKIGYWVWDEIEDKAIYCSDELAKMFGVASGDELAAMLSSHAADLEWVHPDDRERFDQAARTAGETKGGFNIEYRIVNAVGETRHVHVIEEPVLDERGKIILSSGTSQDITERKRAEEALRESEERFRTLVEFAPEAITMLDVDTGLYLDANPMAEALHGLPRDELIGKLGPADLSPEIQPDGRPSSEAAPDYLSRALAGEFPRFEWMHLDPDGHETLCEVSLARLPDPHRNLVRASIIDITERKAAEAQRAELEAKLAQAQKMEAVGQLTGGIAHDFNNLLAVISLNADFVGDALEKGSSAAESLESMTQVVDRGAELTHRLLAYSRQQTLESKVTDANGLVTGMTDMLRRTLGETIEIETVLADDLLRTWVDPHQLENALLNLAINARDAMPKGGKLTIETANIALDEDYAAAQGDVAPGDYVRLSVSDSGMGMAPEVIERVFEPFYTTKDVGKGTGLGLPMIYGFVKQSGGHVTIYSEQGRGTTVHLYLPATEAIAQAAEAPAAEAKSPIRGETVLVVEDDADVRRLVAKILNDLGYRVLEAGDGSQALATLERAPGVDLLLSDVVLPGGRSGPEIVAQAQRHRPGLKSLFMSGYAPGSMTHQGRLPEGAALLNKPFTKHELARKVRAVLDG